MTGLGKLFFVLCLFCQLLDLALNLRRQFDENCVSGGKQNACDFLEADSRTGTACTNSGELRSVVSAAAKAIRRYVPKARSIMRQMTSPMSLNQGEAFRTRSSRAWAANRSSGEQLRARRIFRKRMNLIKSP